LPKAFVRLKLSGIKGAWLPWKYAGGLKAKNSTSEGNYYYGFYSIIRMVLSLLVAAKGRAGLFLCSISFASMVNTP
jgi:hypothetical protein